MGCKFGMPVLIENKNIKDNILLCNELGLNFLELNMNLPYCMPQNVNIQEILNLKHKYNIDFTMHFPEEIDFGCFYENIRQANINLFKNLAEFAHNIEVKKINIHLNPGVYFTLPDKKEFVYEKNSDLFIRNFKNSIIELIKICKNLNIDLCIENMVGYDFVCKAFLELSKIKDCNFTWDVGHDAMHEYKISNIYLENEEKVKHMHLHDFNGKSDHQVLFTGKVPIKKRIEFANKNNLTVLIEIKTVDALKKSVLKLKNLNYI